MNKSRAKKLLKLADKITEIRQQLEEICEQEQEYYDNLSEKSQESEKGEFSSECISSIENAVTELESASDSLGNCEIPDD